MAKDRTQKGRDRAATIEALVGEREEAQANANKFALERAAAEREQRKWAKRVRELNEKIAQAAVS